MNPTDDDLPALRAPASGRRTDDAFARAVASDVAAHRTRFRRLVLALPAAAGAAAVVFAVTRPDVAAVVPPDPIRVAVVVDAGVDAGVGTAIDAVDAVAVDALAFFDDDGDGLLAFADDGDDEGDDFAIPGLAGSSDRELEDIEAALDRALKL